MGLWSAYFLAKLLLYGLGYLDFHAWQNLAFAVFTALQPKNARQRLTKNLIAVPVGILLLYHDSWLPPPTSVLAHAQALRSFSSLYLLELAGRIFTWQLLLEVAALIAVYALARRKLRLSTFAFVGILAVMLAPQWRLWLPRASGPTAAAVGIPVSVEADARNLSPQALDARLTRFYSEQGKIQVRFTRPAAADVPYDVLILHVCSLSWDDLKTLKLTGDAFFSRFDLTVSHFNSAASYSGPAAIRLLRGACGQTPEARLYEPTSSECLVVDGLQNAGFEPHWLMNHDGHFGNFFGDVRDRGGLSVPLESDAGATPAQQAFDGTPVYGDYSTLSRWWAKREQNHAARVVLYYNTISLHDGNRVVGPGRSDSSYAARFAQLSGDIGRFLDDLRSSGRHVVVVFIAEHGAALAGDRRQISGLREIPTGGIAHVPVAIALVNAPRSVRASERLDAPASYPAVNELLARFSADDPFNKPSLNLEPYTTGLPRADFVAENNATTVMQLGAEYMMRSPDGTWTSLD